MAAQNTPQKRTIKDFKCQEAFSDFEIKMHYLCEIAPGGSVRWRRSFGMPSLKGFADDIFGGDSRISDHFFAKIANGTQFLFSRFLVSRAVVEFPSLNLEWGGVVFDKNPLLCLLERDMLDETPLVIHEALYYIMWRQAQKWFQSVLECREEKRRTKEIRRRYHINVPIYEPLSRDAFFRKITEPIMTDKALDVELTQFMKRLVSGGVTGGPKAKLMIRIPPFMSDSELDSEYFRTPGFGVGIIDDEDDGVLGRM